MPEMPDRPKPMSLFATGTDNLSPGILPCSIELHRSLHRLERIARVEFSDQFRIIDTVDIGRRLLEHLPYRETLCDVGANSISGTAILRQVVTDHLGVLEGVDRGIPPAIRHEYAFRDSWLRQWHQ